MLGMFCNRCHSLLPPGSKRCTSCGSPINPEWISNQSSLDGIGPKKQSVQLVKEENKDAPYLPYQPRGCQMDIINDIRHALDEGRAAVTRRVKLRAVVKRADVVHAHMLAFVSHVFSFVKPIRYGIRV